MTDIVDNYPVTEQEFINLLEDYNTAYREGLDATPKGREPVTDAVYDAITEDFRSKFPDSPWFEKVEEESKIEGVDDVYHKRPMLSTDKAYTSDDMDKWIARIKKHQKKLTKILKTFILELHLNLTDQQVMMKTMFLLPVETECAAAVLIMLLTVD